jgi:hypothetical protein
LRRPPANPRPILRKKVMHLTQPAHGLCSRPALQTRYNSPPPPLPNSARFCRVLPDSAKSCRDLALLGRSNMDAPKGDFP